MQQDRKEPSLTRLLDSVDEDAAQREEAKVSFGELLDRVGQNAITPLILLVAIFMVSPLSGVPGTPTFAALVIFTMTVQALSGRKRLWLPDFLMRQKIKAGYVHRAVSWLRKPCAFLDQHSQERLRFLTTGPMRWLTLSVSALIPLSWPLLELLPMVTSIGAGTIALLVFGLFTRDGVYVLWGYCAVGLAGVATYSLV